MADNQEIQRTLTDLRPNTRYIVRTRAINGFGVRSEWSEALDFTTSTDESIPKPPENLEAGFNNSDLLIKWTAPENNTDWTPLIDFSHYEVTITPSPATTPANFVHETSEIMYVFTYQMNANIWDDVQGSVTVEVRVVDTAGNRSDPATAIAIASGDLTESGVSTGDLSALGVVFDSDYDAGTLLYATTDNTPQTKTISQLKTLLALDTEDIQDIVGAMVSGNTETNITVTYNDSTGKLDFTITSYLPLTGGTVSGNLTLSGALDHDGSTIGFFGVAPTARQTELTDELTTITHTAPGTPDYAIQNLTNAGGFGFATQDEGNTVLSVIANLQTRVNELETKLTAYGLLQDAD